MRERDDDRADILAVLNRYADAADGRDWSLFGDVFTPDATADYGGRELSGRDAIVRLILSSLGGCGPSQHLLGNHTARVEGDHARASCTVRAFHRGAGDQADKTYEVLGRYHHDLVRTRDGWRTRRLRMDVTAELGTRDVLRPAT